MRELPARRRPEVAAIVELRGHHVLQSHWANLSDSNGLTSHIVGLVNTIWEWDARHLGSHVFSQNPAALLDKLPAIVLTLGARD